MARAFAAASSQYLEVSAGLISDVPATLAAWFRPNDVATTYTIISLGVTASSRLSVVAAGAAAGDFVNALTARADGTSSSASSTAGFTANTWYHGCGVFASLTDRRAFLDGGNKGTNATSRALVTPTRTNIAARYASSALGSFFDGAIAEAAIWDVDLTDAEVAILGKGYCPLFVRPRNLVFYAPLIGVYSPEIEIIQGNNLTLNASPTTLAHPRIIYPSMDQIVAIAGTTPALNNGNFFMFM